MDVFEENEYSSLELELLQWITQKKNAGKLIDILTLKYHRARQEYNY